MADPPISAEVEVGAVLEGAVLPEPVRLCSWRKWRGS